MPRLPQLSQVSPQTRTGYIPTPQISTHTGSFAPVAEGVNRIVAAEVQRADQTQAQKAINALREQSTAYMSDDKVGLSQMSGPAFMAAGPERQEQLVKSAQESFEALNPRQQHMATEEMRRVLQDFDTTLGSRMAMETAKERAVAYGGGRDSIVDNAAATLRDDAKAGLPLDEHKIDGYGDALVSHVVNHVLSDPDGVPRAYIPEEGTDERREMENFAHAHGLTIAQAAWAMPEIEEGLSEVHRGALDGLLDPAASDDQAAKEYLEEYGSEMTREDREEYERFVFVAAIEGDSKRAADELYVEANFWSDAKETMGDDYQSPTEALQATYLAIDEKFAGDDKRRKRAREIAKAKHDEARRLASDTLKEHSSRLLSSLDQNGDYSSILKDPWYSRMTKDQRDRVEALRYEQAGGRPTVKQNVHFYKVMDDVERLGPEKAREVYGDFHEDRGLASVHAEQLEFMVGRGTVDPEGLGTSESTVSDFVKRAFPGEKEQYSEEAIQYRDALRAALNSYMVENKVTELNALEASQVLRGYRTEAVLERAAEDGFRDSTITFAARTQELIFEVNKYLPDSRKRELTEDQIQTLQEEWQFRLEANPDASLPDFHRRWLQDIAEEMEAAQVEAAKKSAGRAWVPPDATTDQVISAEASVLADQDFHTVFEETGFPPGPRAAREYQRRAYERRYGNPAGIEVRGDNP